MSPEVQAAFFLAAVVCFLLDAFRVRAAVNLSALGLALFAFVFFWQAADAGWFG